MTVATKPPPWLTEARKWLGLKEAPGAANNPAIVAMYKDAGQGGVKQDSVPWCAAFVGAMLKRVGLKGTGTLWALDYSKWGQRLKEPVLGAIATKKRDGGGHVGFVVAANKTTVWLLGGNQNDAVNVARYPRSAIYSYALPSGFDAKTLPKLPSTATGKAGVTET